VPGHRDDQLSSQAAAALDEITAAATGAVAELVASSAGEPEPAAVRGVEAVTQQLAEQQVAVLVVAADFADASGARCGIGSRPTELLAADDPAARAQVPLADGLAWAALHQDAIVVQLPDRAGPLAGWPAAALLRRGPAA
jgi:hypothetical protein